MPSVCTIYHQSFEKLISSMFWTHHIISKPIKNEILIFWTVRIPACGFLTRLRGQVYRKKSTLPRRTKIRRLTNRAIRGTARWSQLVIYEVEIHFPNIWLSTFIFSIFGLFLQYEGYSPSISTILLLFYRKVESVKSPYPNRVKNDLKCWMLKVVSSQCSSTSQPT